MTQQQDDTGKYRAASLMSELALAKRKVQGGAIGLVLRVTLAVIFMGLIVISYGLRGATGPVFVSVLFLLALFIPSLYEVARHRFARPEARESAAKVRREARQEA